MRSLARARVADRLDQGGVAAAVRRAGAGWGRSVGRLERDLAAAYYIAHPRPAFIRVIFWDADEGAR